MAQATVIASRKEREKAQRREAIQEAAMHLFFDQGFERTTMDQIAERAELSKGTLYLYFSSKAELYVSLILQGFNLLAVSLGEKLKDMPPEADPFERGRLWLFEFIEHSLKHREHFRITQYFLTDEARSNISQEMVDEVNAGHRAFLSMIATLVEEAKDQGLAAQTVDAHSFAVIAWRMTTGILDLAVIDEDIGAETPQAYRNLFDQAFDILMDGIRPR
jgi:AcrR family transcriptional regulator